ncbi:cation:proton antiporter [Frigoribacterium sp. CG_9.8]|uniref:cation:proton antiporter n=1 Tax=Frigoribacterium sp. CG_9.8 TaxID=2787733 RepID=UPI0018CA1042|nr:CPA2 family monovalent cation:H+ antiporter-2 [Frigoribacterium sp. CG_9.8]
MHLGEELAILGALLLIAYVFGRLGKLIGLPAIPVYMLVGLLASPNTGWFPLNFDSGKIELIAVFGLILLLFNLGIEFDQDEFFGNAGKLIVSGGSYIAVNMAVGFAFGFWVGWGTREALIIAGITATSSSAIVTKLLIELNRLPNRETPMILGVTVVEDIFIAVYLAIVGVVLSGETAIWPVVGKLGISFLFLVVMFTIARWGGKWVSKLFRTKDDELFTILFFGLAVGFGGIGELLGVTDAIGAFLIGLVLGATKYRSKIEQFSLPMRDVFGAFFFLNFGLTLNISQFPTVFLPVAGAVAMTVLLNTIAGQFVARLNKLGPQAGINATAILQNRGEFALILATLSISAGLDSRIVPFAGLYVLVMSIIGPILAANSEKIGAVILRTKKKKNRAAAKPNVMMAEENIALVEAATAGLDAGDPDHAVTAADRLIQQAMLQSDAQAERTRDPEY